MTERGRVVTLQIVDDDPRFLRLQKQLLSRAPSLEVVATSVTGEEAIEDHFQQFPDVTLLDLEMPGLSGTDVLRAIHRRRPQAKIVILSGHASAEWARPALLHGAVGYLVKGSPLEQYALAITAAVQGSTMIDPQVLRSAVSAPPPVRAAGLHLRQQKVLAHVSKGLSNREIAASLGVSHATVKRDIADLLDFFGVRNRAQLVARALSPLS